MSTRPLLVSASPADNSGTVAVANNIVLTFNENVFIGTGNLVVSDGFSQSFMDKSGALQTHWLGATDVRSVPAGDGQITISGNTVTINLGDDLQPGLNYAVYIPRGFLVDANNVPFAGLLDSSKLNFTTAGGIAAPTAHVGATIGFEDTGISASDYITNSAAQTVHGTYTGTLGANDSVQVSIDNGVTWHSANASAGSWTCSSFDAVTASSTLVARVVNTQGVSSGSVSHSYVFDNTPPTVLSATISDSNLTAGETATVTITFSEAVSNFSILNATVNSATYGAWTSSDNGLSWSASVTPNALLQASNVSDQFSVGGTDAAGNNISGGLVTVASYNIDTRISLAITALSADSGSDAHDFVTNVASQTISGTLSASLPGGAHVQISMDGGSSWNNAVVSGTGWSYSGATLQAGTNSLYARILDSSNQSTTPVSQSYTLDTSAPLASLSGITPQLVDDNTGAVNPDNLSNVSTPHIRVSNGGNSNFHAGDQLQIIDTNHGNAIVGSYTITVNDIDANGGAAFDTEDILVGPLSAGEHDLAVRVGDAAGNTPTGLSSTLAVTVDTTPPVLTSAAPANNSSGAAINTSIVLNFNEAVDVGSNLFFTLTDTNDNQQMLGVENGFVTVDGSKVIINLPGALLANTSYSLDLSSGAITDLAGNTAYSGQNHLIGFTTSANGDVNATPHITSANAFAPGSTHFAGQLVNGNGAGTAYVQLLDGANWIHIEPNFQGDGNFTWSGSTSAPTNEISVRMVDSNGVPMQYLDYGNSVLHFGSSGADTINETGDYSIVFGGGGVDTINVGNYAHVVTGAGSATVSAGNNATIVSNGSDMISTGAFSTVTTHGTGTVSASGAGLNLVADNSGGHIISIDNLAVGAISTPGISSADELNVNVNNATFSLATLYATNHISGIDILNINGSNNDITVGAESTVTNFSGATNLEITADAGVASGTTVHIDHSAWSHATQAGGFDVYVGTGVNSSNTLLVLTGITQL